MSEKLNNSTVIKNISYDQKEILYNIMQLHNEGKPFEADMTASTLGFYKTKKSDKYVIPEPKILLDVFPQRKDIIKISEYTPLPLEDNSVESMVCDLPFIVSPKQSPSVLEDKDGSNLMFKRFHSFYPASDMLAQYKYWIEEIYRVLKPNGICVFKTQSTISGGHNYHTSEWSLCVLLIVDIMCLISLSLMQKHVSSAVRLRHKNMLVDILVIFGYLRKMIRKQRK